jgi:hypothetical protein
MNMCRTAAGLEPTDMLFVAFVVVVRETSRSVATLSFNSKLGS